MCEFTLLRRRRHWLALARCRNARPTSQCQPVRVIPIESPRTVIVDKIVENISLYLDFEIESIGKGEEDDSNVGSNKINSDDDGGELGENVDIRKKRN